MGGREEGRGGGEGIPINLCHVANERGGRNTSEVRRIGAALKKREHLLNSSGGRIRKKRSRVIAPAP